MADQGFDPSQTLSQREEPAGGNEIADPIDGCLELGGDHAAETCHLAFGDVVAGMVGQARVVDSGNQGVTLEGIGDGSRVVRLSRDAKFQRL